MRDVPSAGNLNGISSEEARRELQRVLDSRTFLAAPQLRRFLEFVADAAIEGRPDEIKEYTIGTHVFSRRDFDPRADTLVRTQASRLRARLETYFRDEGAGDEVLIEIPKGGYVPRFDRRAVATEIEPAGAPAVTRQARRFWPPPAGFAWSALAVVALVAAFQWLAGSRTKPAGIPPGHGLVAQLWSGFVNGQDPPLVCYSNHVSLINEAQDQLYYNGQDELPKGTQVNEPPTAVPVRDQRILRLMGPVFFNDGLTGTGEVAGVADLARTFTQLGSDLIVRRSQLLSPAELKRHGVVFLGAPSANALLRALPPVGEFQFDRSKECVGFWRGRILNTHPKPGERAAYGVERDEATKALRADYALVSFLPGIAPGSRLAVLAGISTEGTQAAADFATSAAGVAQIADRLGTGSKRALPPYFQALLRVEIAKSDILRIQYVTGRVIPGGA
ncbi:MAG TPA: hypothetical protein VG672_10725 [Bryobacteraceae bacterium]|nr:hypothetical protein [Bryobacteraceae bacterium]